MADRGRIHPRLQGKGSGADGHPRRLLLAPSLPPPALCLPYHLPPPDTGTDEKTLTRIMVSRSEIVLLNIRGGSSSKKYDKVSPPSH